MGCWLMEWERFGRVLLRGLLREAGLEPTPTEVYERWQREGVPQTEAAQRDYAVWQQSKAPHATG